MPSQGQRQARLRGPCPCLWPAGQLDEGGVQGPGILLAEGTGLKQLLDEGRFLLLQLRDPFTLVSHLLAGGGGGSQGLPGCQLPPTPLLRLTWVRSRFCSFSMRMVCCCQPGSRAGPGGPKEDEGRACRRVPSGRPGIPQLSLQDKHEG